MPHRFRADGGRHTTIWTNGASRTTLENKRFRRKLSPFFSAGHRAFFHAPRLLALVAANDLRSLFLIMIYSRADRCIDLNDHGQLRGRVTLGEGGGSRLAVVVTVAKGCDLGYIWKTQGQASGERTPGGYYINAAQAGEPPGRWWGPGAQALGFTSGQVVGA